MGDDVAAILLTLAAENAELHEQLAAAQDMLLETAVDAGRLHARAETLAAECNAWRVEAERLAARSLAVA